MKNIGAILLFFFLFLQQTGFLHAQNDSILPKKIEKEQFIKQNILPVSLIIGGSLLSGSSVEKDFQVYVRNQVGNDFKCHLDNYLEYMPAVEMYLADIMGVKSENHWFDQTKYLVISQVISSNVTHWLKRITDKTRPAGDPYAFPSGHSTFAFTNAGVLYHEFKDSSPILVFNGYLMATATAGLRIANNRHWLSDVLAGAGIGLLTTEIVYYVKPLKKFNPFKKTDGMVLIPYKDTEVIGFYFSYMF